MKNSVVVRSVTARMNSSDADSWHALGVALVALGDRSGAFTALRNALMLDGSRTDTQLALGNLLFDSGRLDDALRCFESAAAHGINPSQGEK